MLRSWSEVDRAVASVRLICVVATDDFQDLRKRERRLADNIEACLQRFPTSDEIPETWLFRLIRRDPSDDSTILQLLLDLATVIRIIRALANGYSFCTTIIAVRDTFGSQVDPQAPFLKFALPAVMVPPSDVTYLQARAFD